MSRLRLSLTIPGAVSLGAYEGGALAALVVAAQSLGEDELLIDSIAAASAGSITALLTARALLRGVDPVALMKAAWVDNVSFDAMKTHSTDSPLSSQALTTMAEAVLGPQGPPDGAQSTWQQQGIRVSMALTNLAGLTYDLPDLSRDRDTVIQAATFLDWDEMTLTRDDDASVYLTRAQSAIASGSNAIGFPAKSLDRTASSAAYAAAGLQGFPADGHFWYTDGGTVDNEPLGRTIDLAQAIAGESGTDDERLYLLIHPDPGSPKVSGPSEWSGDAPLPGWVKTGTHAFGITRTQTIFEDLKRLEKMNSRLRWVELIGPAIEAGIATGVADGGLSDEQASRVRAAIASAASRTLEEIRTSQADVSEKAGRARPADARPVAAAPASVADGVAALIGAASGLEGRDLVEVEVVSPAVDPTETKSPSELLAGAFFFHFGGFFDVKFRQSDFALGYRNMAYWLRHCLPDYTSCDLEPALTAVQAAYVKLGWDDVDEGGASLASLSASEKWGLGHLALHVAHVIGHDVIHGEA